MRNPSLIFILTTVLSSTGFAQEYLVKASDITYRTEFEKTVLSAYFNEKSRDGFNLFMAAGNLSPDAKVKDSKKRFYEHLEQFKQDKISSKSSDKKTRYIYENLHKNFLKKYEGMATFEEIFYNGNFSSVSASALYALAFEELKIPFTIKEEPTHVYLIAYPDNERIKIETTTPTTGVMTLNNAFKQFIKSLKDQKLISPSEANSRSIDELFDKYYFGNQQDITLTNLVGLQYMNEALQNNEQKRFDEALVQMEKAYLLYPTPRTAYLLMVSGTAAFEARKEKDSVHAQYLGKLSKFKELGMTADVITGEFARAINHLLFEKGRKDQALQYYRILRRHIQDIPLGTEIDFIYHYECGRLSYNQARYKEATSFFEKALEAKPGNLEIANTLIASLSQTFSASGNNLDHMAMLEKYAEKYPTLLENNIFNNMLATSYLIQAGFEFDQEAPQQGEKYRLLFEDQLKKFPDLPINSQLVGHAYSRSAIFYFRKGQTSKAKSIIETGLKFSPNNFELLSRKQMIR